MTHDGDDVTALNRLDLFHQILVSRYFVGVSLTLSVYDWLLLLEREGETVWKTRWTWSKTIYYSNRFTNLVGMTIVAMMNSDLWMPPHALCAIDWLPSILGWVSFLLGNIILTLRVVAIYHHYIFVVRSLWLLLFLSWASSFAFMLQCFIQLNPRTYASPIFHTCVSDAPYAVASGIFLGPTIFECVLFLFTLYRAIPYMRRKDQVPNSETPLLTTLYRDGFYYFAAIFSVQLWNIIAYSTQPVKSDYMSAHFAWAVMTVMSSRISLNLIRASYSIERDTMLTTTGAITGSSTSRSIQDLRNSRAYSVQPETFRLDSMLHSLPTTTSTMLTFTTTTAGRNNVGGNPECERIIYRFVVQQVARSFSVLMVRVGWLRGRRPRTEDRDIFRASDRTHVTFY